MKNKKAIVATQPRKLMLTRASELMKRVLLSFMGIKMVFDVKWDQRFVGHILDIYLNEPRVFIQIRYWAPDHGKGRKKEWKSRKWYLSEYMTDDEIVKTAFLAFRTCIEHEVLEGFKVDDSTLFNPHVNFEELLTVSHKEVQRQTLVNKT